MCSRRFKWTKTCRPTRHHRTQEDSQKHNPHRLISSLLLLSQDAARPWTCAWMCAWPPPTQRKQPPIVKFHVVDTKFQKFEIKVSSTAPQKSLQHRGKHEIKIALLRRRAALIRAVPSCARAEWLLAGLIDRVRSLQVRARPERSWLTFDDG